MRLCDEDGVDGAEDMYSRHITCEVPQSTVTTSFHS